MKLYFAAHESYRWQLGVKGITFDDKIVNHFHPYGIDTFDYILKERHNLQVVLKQVSCVLKSLQTLYALIR